MERSEHAAPAARERPEDGSSARDRCFRKSLLGCYVLALTMAIMLILIGK